MLKKICIIGHFGKRKTLINGQTIKSKNLYTLLSAEYGKESICLIDTHHRFIFFLLLPFILLNVLRKSQNIFILPAHNGVRIIIPLLTFLNKFYKRIIHYCVIGGWLPKLLAKKKRLSKSIKNVNYIYVETNTLLQKMVSLGFENAMVLPNSKSITKIITVNSSFSEPFKLCTFSRINKLKGIEEAVDAVNEINRMNKRTVCTLDIYGKIDNGEEKWFDDLKLKFGDDIRYCGFVENIETGTVLSNYFILLFPTHYYTEGIPGTLIDGFACGIPVLASRWESFSDVVDEGINGYGFEFDNYQDFCCKLQFLCLNPDKVISLRENCLKKADLFSNDFVLSILRNNII